MEDDSVIGGEREEEDREALEKAWEFVRSRSGHQKDTIALPPFFLVMGHLYGMILVILGNVATELSTRRREGRAVRTCGRRIVSFYSGCLAPARLHKQSSTVWIREQQCGPRNQVEALKGKSLVAPNHSLYSRILNVRGQALG